MAGEFSAEGAGAYSIPYGGISSGDAMKYTAERQQQDQQQNQANEYRLQQAKAKHDEDQRKSSLANFKMIDALPKEYNSDNVDMQAVGNKIIKDYKDQLMAAAQTQDETEFYNTLNKFKQGLSWWDNANTDYKNQKQVFDKWHQEDAKNVDYSDAMAHFNDVFTKNYFKDGGGGNLVYNPDAKPIDILTEIQKPERIKHMKVDYQPLFDVVDKLPKDQLETSVTYGTSGKGGRKRSEKVKGFVTPFSTDAVRNPDGTYSRELMSENVGGGKGLPKILDQTIQSNTAANLAATHLFENTKDAKGVNYDPRIEPELKSRVLYKTLNDRMKPVHSVSTAKSDVQNIVVNTGSGSGSKSGGSGEYELNNVYKEITDKAISKQNHVPLNELSGTAQAIVLKYARDLSPKDDDINQGNVFISKHQNGELWIRKRTEKEDGQGGYNYQDIAPLDYKDVNLKAQPSVKEKRAVISHAPTNKVAPTNKSKQNDPLGIL